MEQLRVKKGIEIGVNDNGDTICIDIENTLFVDKFRKMISDIEEIIDGIDTSVEIPEEKLGTVTRDYMKKICEKLDECLGERCCEKVFGCIPTIYAVYEFLDLLEPIIIKYTKQREAMITTKYKPRKGGKRV